jgi:beta-glucanase (GH16 family)
MNMKALKLIYEENFGTDLSFGGWKIENNPYTEVWEPFESFTPSRNENSTKKCHLTPDNCEVKDGQLIMRATDGGEMYKGIELRTKQYYHYGYFEIEAKVNSSRGICPAFWFVSSRKSPSRMEYEIDGFECFGERPNVVKTTPLAHNYKGEKYNGTDWDFKCTRLIDEDGDSERSFFVGNWGEDFHKFGVDWQPDLITWYIDGTPVYEMKPSESFDGKNVFNEPMIVILTVYSGVDVANPRTGLPDETTDWENGAAMSIKTIKFYEYKLTESSFK